MLQQAGERAQVVHLVLEVGLTPRSTSWGMCLGAQQHPAEAGGSWAVSPTAEMGTLVHVQWDSMHPGMVRRKGPQACLSLKVPDQPPTRHESSPQHKLAWGKLELLQRKPLPGHFEQ